MSQTTSNKIFTKSICQLNMTLLAYRGLMSIVGKNQVMERVTPRLRTINTCQKGSCATVKGTVAWKKAYLQKDYCESSNAYACERPATGGSGVQGQGMSLIQSRF